MSIDASQQPINRESADEGARTDPVQTMAGEPGAEAPTTNQEAPGFVVGTSAQEARLGPSAGGPAQPPLEPTSAERAHRPSGGLRRKVAPLLLAGAMLASAAGGGVVGGIATLAWIGKQPTPAGVVVAPPIPLQLAGYSAAAQGLDVAGIYRRVSPAVVAINVSSAAPRGFGPGAQGEGTGVVVAEDGSILTNNHVVSGARKVTVTLEDGTRLDAKVVGTDPASDLAIIQADIPKDKLVVATLGDSDAVVPGEPAIAIGMPFGLDHTVTAGIVSAIQRDWGTAGGRPMRGLIQTDAPINPGNSGGPLLNSRGEVIGITTAIESPVRGSVGIGFAVPINRAKQFLPQLVRGEKVEHPWLGISGIALTPDVAQHANLGVDQGVLVAEALPGSPAEQAGLRGGSQQDGEPPVGGDVITTVDGKPIKSIQELSGYLDTRHVGDMVTLTVVRNGKPVDVPVKLAAWPAQQED